MLIAFINCIRTTKARWKDKEALRAAPTTDEKPLLNYLQHLRLPYQLLNTQNIENKFIL
jgi:hypothetical protein